MLHFPERQSFANLLGHFILFSTHIRFLQSYGLAETPMKSNVAPLPPRHCCGCVCICAAPRRHFRVGDISVLPYVYLPSDHWSASTSPTLPPGRGGGRGTCVSLSTHPCDEGSPKGKVSQLPFAKDCAGKSYFIVFV